MQEYTQTVSATGPSAWIRLDTQGNTLHLYHIMIEVAVGCGVNVDLEFCIQKDLDNATPICHNTLNNVSVTTTSIIQAPLAGVRVNVKKVNVGGSVTLRVLQS